MKLPSHLQQKILFIHTKLMARFLKPTVQKAPPHGQLLHLLHKVVSLLLVVAVVIVKSFRAKLSQIAFICLHFKNLKELVNWNPRHSKDTHENMNTTTLNDSAVPAIGAKMEPSSFIQRSLPSRCCKATRINYGIFDSQVTKTSFESVEFTCGYSCRCLPCFKNSKFCIS